jgi:putative N6-adenine-specific DNA methylase
MASEQMYHAKTFRGLENVLADELKAIGAEKVAVVNRGVNFSGSKALLYRANFSLLTAVRILVPLRSFNAKNEMDLYQQVQRIDWTEYLDLKTSFAIDSVAFSDTFRNSQYVSQKIKDAIADQFRRKTNLRPSVNLRTPDIRINAHIVRNQVTLSLDSSGESLHKRGYRVKSHPASMNEILAAGIIKLMGWRSGTLLNPMCGAGTLAIEALLHATGIPPAVFGRTYAFEKWKDFDNILYQRVLESITPGEPPDMQIIASDMDPEAIRMTRNNLRQANLSEFIEVKNIDFTDYPLQETPADLIINPPYGERLTPEDLNGLYASIGSTLKHRFPGSRAWLFSSNPEAIKSIGLKPEQKITLYNASLECKLIKYQLFEGKRKDRFSPA